MTTTLTTGQFSRSTAGDNINRQVVNAATRIRERFLVEHTFNPHGSPTGGGNSGDQGFFRPLPSPVLPPSKSVESSNAMLKVLTLISAALLLLLIAARH